MLNALLGQRLARVSATPGKTTALNVYEVSGPPAYLLDLPGYGYARASHADRTAYRGLVTHVVERPNLRGIVWLLDIRRDPSPDDLAMQDVFAAAGTRVLAAVTKSDKLPRGQRQTRVRALQGDLRLPDDQLVVTSARHGEGISELRDAVAALTEGQNP